MERNDHYRKNMDINFISSTPIKQSSYNFHVLEEFNEHESSEETDSESNITDDKIVNAKEEPQHSSRSTDFESNASGLPVSDSQEDVKNSSSFESPLPTYDYIDNYLLPRPQYMKYDPVLHLEIVERQEKLKRIIDKFVEKTEEIAEESVDNQEEYLDIHQNEDEKEDKEEFEDDDKWSLKVFLQYLLVMVVLILMTLTISSTNSTHVSPIIMHGLNVSETEVEAFSPVMLMWRYLNDIEIDEGFKKLDQNVLTVNSKELVAIQHEQLADVFEDDDIEDLEIEETVMNNEIDFIKHEPVILRVLDENEAYVDLDLTDVKGELGILKSMVDDDDDNNKSLNVNEIETEVKENADNVTKLRYFDPFFLAYSVIAVVIFACTSVLHYSMHTEIRNINEGFDERSSVESFDSINSRFFNESHMDECSSNQIGYFDFQQSTVDSPSHGSFTMEKRIVKKQRSNTSEVMTSTVRRSSRIHNRSISSP